MFGRRQFGRKAGHIGLAVLLTALVPTCADAAWLGYKNNTPAAVIIQAADVVVVNGKQQVRPGKPHALYPGEVAWDAVSAAGPRIITVFDPSQKNRPVLQDRVDTNGKEDLFLSFQFVTPPPAKGQPPQPPQLKLVPVPIPQLPKGQLPPGVTPGTPPPASPPPGTPPPGKPPANPTPPATLPAGGSRGPGG